MSEALRNMIFNASQPEQEASFTREAFDLGDWSPYLNTRMTSEQRSDRAARLIACSRKLEDSRNDH